MNTPDSDHAGDLSNRRGFVKKALALAIGVGSGALPVGAVLTVVLAPLQRRARRGTEVFVTTLDSLSADGTPRKFPVMATKVDAWNRSEGFVGAVYLRRAAGGVVALNVACPHAGCFVDFQPSNAGFYCPCHNSQFSLDGQISDPRSPAPRGMDSLEAEIRNESQVWVRFQNFRAGQAKKVAV